MVLHTLLEKLPLSQGGKVFVGTALCIGICAIPLMKSAFFSCYQRVTRAALTHSHPHSDTETKAGHDLFSSEKPQDVYDSEIQRRRAKISDADLPSK